MKKFNNYDEAAKSAQYTGNAKLPAGAYVCKILAIKYEAGENGTSDRIALQFDVAEGEQKGFFKKQYEENTNADKKWKGSVRIYVPTDDGSEKDEWTKKSFAGWTTSIEASNSGYLWDWDETKWKNKIVGIVFGETGNVIEGREVTYTEPRFAVNADKVRNGSAPEAKFKSKNGWTGKQKASAPSSEDNRWTSVPEGTEADIPF